MGFRPSSYIVRSALTILRSFHPSFGISEYQVAYFLAIMLGIGPQNVLKPTWKLRHINSAYIVINTHNFSGDIGTLALIGYMIIAVLNKFSKTCY